MRVATTRSPEDGIAGCYDFGGAAVAITSTDPRWAALVRQRYGDFATDDQPAWRVSYRVRGPRRPSPGFLRDSRGQPMRSRRTGARLRLATETFAIELDHQRRSVELAGPLATYPIDRLIQTLWYETWHRGLIIHAAALAEGQVGWLMSGPSGSGKSTLAALFPERAMGDELAGVRLESPGASPRPRLVSLPFWSGRRGDAELAGIYLLRHGKRDRRRRLAPGEAFARLRREIVWPTFDPQALERAFDTLFELLASVPIWELAFRPRHDVWQVIRREVE